MTLKNISGKELEVLVQLYTFRNQPLLRDIIEYNDDIKKDIESGFSALLVLHNNSYAVKSIKVLSKNVDGIEIRCIKNTGNYQILKGNDFVLILVKNELVEEIKRYRQFCDF